MTSEIYDEREIIRYLLGSLSEDETVRYDELSFTDDEFAGALKAAEKDLIDAYVRGELSGQTLEQFNSFYLTSPRRREQVRFAQVFQDFAGKAIERQTVASEEAARATRWRFSELLSDLNFFAASRRAWSWGLAPAALVLLLAGSWLVFENRRLREQANQAQPKGGELGRRAEELQTQLAEERAAHAEAEKELARIREELTQFEAEQQQQQRRAAPQQQRGSSPSRFSVASFILAPQTRGVGQVAPISVPARIDYVNMKLELESDDHPVYRVALRKDADRQIIWQSGPLRARTSGKNKILVVSLRADLLPPQVYALEVSGVPARGAAEIVGGYPFKVVKQ